MICGSLIVKGNHEAGKAQSLYHVLLRMVILESSNNFSTEKVRDNVEKSKGGLYDIFIERRRHATV